MHARALWFEGPGRLTLRDEEIRPRAGDAVVEARLMGISHGTELLVWRGELPEGLETDAALPGLAGKLAYPLKYGYSNAGVADSGHRVFAFYPHQECFCLPAVELLELPDGLEFEDAVFLASMETALSIAHDAAPRYGESVMIVGLGVVGLLLAEILLRGGARPVVGLERHELRREAARRAGCEVLDPSSESARPRIQSLTGGRGFDVAVNTSGSAAGLQLAMDSTAFEGTVVEASWYGSRLVSLELGVSFHRKRLRLRSSQVSRIDPALTGRWDRARRFGTVMELLSATRPSRLITHHFPLDRAGEAFALIDKRPGECIQVVLDP